MSTFTGQLSNIFVSANLQEPSHLVLSEIGNPDPFGNLLVIIDDIGLGPDPAGSGNGVLGQTLCETLDAVIICILKAT